MPISRRRLLKTGAAAAAGIALWRPDGQAAQAAQAQTPERLPIAPGPFQPTWDSLAKYDAPEWFRDAKFGIWAHWTAQCVPEMGDWYARQMYQQGNPDYDYQCAHYGHPSKVGFKDIDHIWHAEHWDPEHLIGLYKAAGAKYFMALAQHHDNFDCYDSQYQTWNSIAIGPHKDIVGIWEKAARKNGLRFAISSHGSHAWIFFQTAQGADKTGPLAGVPYDGKLTKADGAGQWWEGLDPQELYAQNHAPGGFDWVWGPSDTRPTDAYMDKFERRIFDLIDKYQPDLLYFDDTVMPFYPIRDTGLRIAAHLYNSNIKRNGGKLEAVMTGKGLSIPQQNCLVMDYERGRSDAIDPKPWQTDTCIGDWHYRLSIYENHQYKTPDQVVKMLVDIVSKNGNLMLNIPVRGDGTIDPDELAFLAGMTAWMNVNSESIYATRPWSVWGEGPVKMKGGGFSEGGENRLTDADFRFATKGNVLYATAMGWPENGTLTVRTLAGSAGPGVDATGIVGDVKTVELLGHGRVPFQRTPDGLSVTLPAQKPCDYAYVLKITGLDLSASHPVLPPTLPTHAAADGTYTLLAEGADLHGTQIQVQDGAVTNVGYWDNSKDYVSWRVHFGAPGTYVVSAKVSSQDGVSALAIDAGAGGAVTLAVPKTADWDTYEAVTGGPLTVAAPGDAVVTVRPADPATWKPINLASVTLTPK